MKNSILLTVVCLVFFLPIKLSIAQGDQSFLNPPKVFLKSQYQNHHQIQEREFSGIPSLAITPDGVFWSVWYAGITPGEDQNNYVVLSKSVDGENWEEVLVVDPDGPGPVRAFDPEIWVDPNGKLWVFWAQTIGMDGSISGVWAMTAEGPDDNAGWSEPKRLTDGIMMCKPLVLSTGEWVIPASTWRLTDNSARMVVSEDKGQSWTVKGAVNVPKDNRVYDEHMMVEKKDGTLWMLIRTNYGIGESHSEDGGKTWSSLQPSLFAHPSARFFIRRLESGNLLMVKHGPLTMRTGRSHLMAFVSDNDGKTWSRGLLLDERPGVSYPDGQQHEDGIIYITYDHDRRGKQEILMTSFSEATVWHSAYDRNMVEVFQNRKIISSRQ